MDINELKIKMFELRREIDALNAMEQQKIAEYNKLMEVLVEYERKNDNRNDSSGQEGKDKGVSESPK